MAEDVTGPEMTWMDRLAVETEEALAGPGAKPIVCASGISPSGPIHMGNLREVFTTHLVAEALRARGHEVVHLHSWDDYDRFRKVPAGMNESLEAFVGQPLSAVPDPFGEYDSFASRFIGEFTAALDVLGIQMRQVRQSECYPSGVYNASIRRAMDQREVIFDVLEAQQTPGRQELPAEERRRRYFPFKPYCEACGKDTTTVEAHTDDTVRYRCRCSHEGEMSLADGVTISGKLVWKADWPMRWAHESVAFEPAGEDHHAPTGSFTVGRQLVEKVYGGTAPHSTVYTFVTLAGAAGKMSGSAGGAPIPSTVLEVLEPAMVRWLYVRRLPSQSFQVDLSPRSVQRLYDEWDRFTDQASTTEASHMDRRFMSAALNTSEGTVASSSRPVPFRLLGSAADVTQANQDQMVRLVAQHLENAEGTPEVHPEELEPRLTCAVNWATKLVPREDRTTIRETFDPETWDGLDQATRHGVHLLARGLSEAWSLEALTALVYGVPKQLVGLPADAKPTPKLKKTQREFFKVLYQLLCASDTGPRLPTLLLSIGKETARELLVGSAEDPGPTSLATSAIE